MELPVIRQTMKQDLEPTGIHPDAVEGTSPSTAWMEVFGDGEGRDAGIWECTPGKYRMKRGSDESCYILQGHWKLIGEHGDEYEVRTGDVLYLRKGWSGISQVVETICKVYMAA